MIRTQVQLTEQQAEVLRRRSKRERTSVAELVRQAIDAFTRAEPPGERELRDRAIGAVGRFASGVRDTSSRHDEALAEAFRSR
jgi:Ribbon-helix-helix protein, copG family